jgi:hypothetical protein
MRFRLAGSVALLSLLCACGYTLQTSRSPLVEKEGIRRIYVSPLINNTYKVGVENVVYNAVLRKLAQHKMVSIVPSADEADAVLMGTVTTAIYRESGRTSIPSRGAIASQYTATLAVAFDLRRHREQPGRKSRIWTGTVARSGNFASAVQQGVRGETTALINESEFERMLADLAWGMMSEVHESMLAMF